ncbi:MAG: beta-lactamase family protein [Marinicaulis sp.]|nr:beta-lactamase family protein [Marinicaulis sp.]
MRSFLLFTLSTISALALWAVLVFIGTTNGWTRKPLAPQGDAPAFAAAAAKAIDTSYNGNAAFALLVDGAVISEHFVSIGEPVDRDTLFQVGSLSKWIAAWGVMTLVDAGKLDLDEPVSSYLTRWQLPDSEFDNDDVTVRRLLSHTAGLTDGLGYAGFAPDGEIQSLEQSLTSAADASPGVDGRVQVGIEPGTVFQYSGGGYTLLQLLIEEVTGETFAAYMDHAVFQPLNMQRSTYVYVENDVSNVAKSYDVDGTQATRFRFTGLAPTALYTTVADMTIFIQAHLKNQSGAPSGRDVLTPNTIKLMQKPHASQMGLDIWGLGTILYAPNKDGGFVVGHDGNDEPAINSAVRFNPATGNGIIILETGNELMATKIAGDWVFWEVETIDLFTFGMIAGDMIKVILIGAAVIILFALILGWRMIRRRRRAA